MKIFNRENLELKALALLLSVLLWLYLHLAHKGTFTFISFLRP